MGTMTMVANVCTFTKSICRDFWVHFSKKIIIIHRRLLVISIYIYTEWTYGRMAVWLAACVRQYYRFSVRVSFLWPIKFKRSNLKSLTFRFAIVFHFVRLCVVPSIDKFLKYGTQCICTVDHTYDVRIPHSF